jgi:hypothetical protein
MCVAMSILQRRTVVQIDSSHVHWPILYRVLFVDYSREKVSLHSLRLMSDNQSRARG